MRSFVVFALALFVSGSSVLAQSGPIARTAKLELARLAAAKAPDPLGPSSRSGGRNSDKHRRQHRRHEELHLRLRR